METVFDSDIITIEYDDTKKLLVSTTKPQAGKVISPEQMREIVEKDAELLGRHKPDYALNDHSKSEYIYRVEEQKWVAHTILEGCVKGGVKKLAFVVADNNIFVEISQQQAGGELKEAPFELEFFTDIKAAKRWLGI